MNRYQIGTSLCLLLVSQFTFATTEVDEATKLKPKIRVETEADTPEIIPTEEVRVFLRDVEVAFKEKTDSLATVVALEKGQLMASVGAKIYVEGLTDDKKREYRLYEKATSLTHPKTKEFLGHGLEYLGKARPIKKVDNSTLELKVIEAKSVIKPGHVIMVGEERLLPYSYNAKPAATKETGYVLDVVGEESFGAASDVIILSLGEREGVLAGETLEIYEHDEQINHGKKVVSVPGERVGRVLIYRTFEKVSLGLVLEATTNIREMSLVRSGQVTG